MNQIAVAFKDWRTTLPGALLASFAVLTALGILIIPDGVQQALIVVILFLVALFDGGVKDWKTSVPSFIIASCGLGVYFFGFNIPGDVVMGLTTLAVTVIGILSGGVDDLKTTIPSTILGLFGVIGFVLGFFGVTLPPNLAQAVATIGVIVYAFVAGQPIPALPTPKE